MQHEFNPVTNTFNITIGKEKLSVTYPELKQLFDKKMAEVDTVMKEVLTIKDLLSKYPILIEEN